MKIGRILPVNNLTRWAIIFYLLGLLSFAAYKSFKHPSLEKLVKGSDMEGYYQYLPVFFLEDWEKFRILPWAKPYGDNKTLSVFTCGTAILQAPFFLAAHAITKTSGLQSNGYSTVYYFFVLLAGLFYATMGLYFLCKSLYRYVDYKTAFWTTSLIFYGTNLFYYTIMGPGMSHVYSFFLMSFFLYRVPIFYDTPNFKSILLVTLPFSLSVLVRPTNAVAILYLIFYNIWGTGDLLQRFRLFINKWRLIMVMGATFILVFVPQMIYWHYVTGNWIVYSYQEEGFKFWNNPQIMTVLFGKRGGWYVYTPLMLIATISLMYMLKRRLLSAPSILLTMVTILYLDASWWAPTFSASAGYRALIEFLPFMAVPLSIGYQKVFTSGNKKLQIFAVSVLWILVLYSVQFAFKYDSTVWWDWEWSYKTMLRLFSF
jgi:hypothetical protein